MYKIEVDPAGDYELWLNNTKLLTEHDVYTHVGGRNVKFLLNLLCDFMNQANKTRAITLSRSLAAKESRYNWWFEEVTSDDFG